MIATYVALKEGVSEEAIRASFKGLELTKNRTEWKKAGNGADILSDVLQCQPNCHAPDFRNLLNHSCQSKWPEVGSSCRYERTRGQSIDLHNQMILSLSPDILDTVIFYGQDIAGLAQLA